jgi:hypothetical protein
VSADLGGVGRRHLCRRKCFRRVGCRYGWVLLARVVALEINEQATVAAAGPDPGEEDRVWSLSPHPVKISLRIPGGRRIRQVRQVGRL